MEKFNEMINGEQLTLVDFFATWCGPCKMMHPILEQLKEKMGDDIRILKVDRKSAMFILPKFYVSSYFGANLQKK